MYEDLVNTLLYDAGWLEQGMTQTEHDIAEHLKKAADAIEELTEIIQNHDFLESLVKLDWIPMTERPPEEELAFYQCCTDAGLVVQCLWTNNRTGLGPLGEWGWRFMDVPSHQYITHWMPLPKPPKEEA